MGLACVAKQHGDSNAIALKTRRNSPIMSTRGRGQKRKSKLRFEPKKLKRVGESESVSKTGCEHSNSLLWGEHAFLCLRRPRVAACGCSRLGCSTTYRAGQAVMGGEEESSWLSIVIDRVDKLALRIGGYEDEAPGEQSSSTRLLCSCPRALSPLFLCCRWNTFAATGSVDVSRLWVRVRCIHLCFCRILRRCRQSYNILPLLL